MRRLITLPLVSLLAMLGLWLGAAAAAAAPAHAGCTTGSITVVTHYGPPGKVSADLATADNPPGCSGIWTRAKSQDGLNYYSGIIKITGINATASTCQDTSDCTHLVKGWLYKHPAGGAVRCRVVYPGTGPWRDCSAHPAPPAHTTALVTSRVCSTYSWSRHLTPEPGWFKIWWTCNGHNPKWQIRAVAHCQDGRNNIVYTGRWVWNVGSRSEASCTSSYPVLAGDGYDAKQCGTCAWKRNWLHGTPVPAETRRQS